MNTYIYIYIYIFIYIYTFIYIYYHDGLQAHDAQHSAVRLDHPQLLLLHLPVIFSLFI